MSTSASRARRAASVAHSPRRVKLTPADSDESATHIAPADVAAWTAENASGVPAIAYHYGSPEHIAHLQREGVDVTRGLGGYFGRGLYAYAEPYTKQHFGDQAVTIAVKMKNPLRGSIDSILALRRRMEGQHPDWPKFSDTTQLGTERGGLGERAHPSDALFVQELLEQGYDGILIKAPGFGVPDVILAFSPGSVRVVS